MTWQKTGTTSQTNGSPIITGSGTSWVDVGTLNPGDMYAAPDGKFYEILSFQSNTGLTLTVNYLGTTASGQAYAIIPIGLLPSALAQQVKSVLTTANAALASAVLSTSAQGLTAIQQGNARANIAALGAADVGAGRLVKSVAGGVDVTLTAAEAANQFLELTGTLTANINLIVPAAARLFVFRNATTGAFTLTVKTATGTGVTVIQSGRMFIECDGTNCVDLLSHMRQLGGSIDGTPIGGTTPAAVAATTLSATTSVSVAQSSATVPLVSARFNGTNFMMGFGIANANGFPYLGMNTNPAVGSDAGTFDIAGYASRIRLDSGIFKFESSTIAGTAGATITWANAATLDSTQFISGVDNSRTLGSATFRWSTVYAGTGSINTSDAREKTPVRGFTPDEINASQQLSKEIGAYRFLSAIAAKGDTAREHIGMTVQRVIEIMIANQLDPFGYGFVCHDDWEDAFIVHAAVEAAAEVLAIPAVLDANGVIVTAAIEAKAAVEAVAAWTEQTQHAGDRYAFRTDELLMFIARGFEARLTALEAIKHG